MEANCETCQHDCKDWEKFECVAAFKTFFWSPKDLTICEDCPMWATLASGTIKCVRHTEPCWKNPNHNDPEEWDEFLQEYKERIK